MDDSLPTLPTPDAEQLSRAEKGYHWLARVVTRMCYNVGEAKVMEALLDAERVPQPPDGALHPVLQYDDEIAAKMRVSEKQVRDWLARLHIDRLVLKTTRDTVKEEGSSSRGGHREALPNAATVRGLWGIDWDVFADAVWFKLDGMLRQLDNGRQALQDSQEYRCPQCNVCVKAVELTPELLDPTTGGFRCEACYASTGQVEAPLISSHCLLHYLTHCLTHCTMHYFTHRLIRTTYRITTSRINSSRISSQVPTQSSGTIGTCHRPSHLTYSAI